MFKYNVNVLKVSGRLNESVLPSKNLVIKSKTRKTDKQVFAEASKYYMKKYGLVIESLNVTGFDGEEPSNFSTGNTRGKASFSRPSNVISFKTEWGKYDVEKNKAISEQFPVQEEYHVIEAILDSVIGKMGKYYSEDNEDTGTSDEFTTTANDERKFTEQDMRDTLRVISNGNKYSYVSVRINNQNELEIYISRQYDGDWVEYKEYWTISL